MNSLLTKHAFAYLLSHGIPAIVGFLGIAIYSRLLSPTEYGHYAFIFASAAIVNAVLFEWLKVSVLRIQQQHELGRAYYMTVKIVFLSLMLISALFALILTFVSTVATLELVLIILLLSWSQSWYQLHLSLLRSELNPLGYGKVAFARSVIGLLCATILIFFDFGATGLVTGFIIGLLLSVFPMTLRRFGLTLAPSTFNVSLVRQFASYGLPLTITLLLGIVIHQSDRLIITAMLGMEATGNYAIAYDLTEQTIFTCMLIINLAAFPIAIRAFEQKGERAAHQQVKRNTEMLLAVGLPVTIGFIVTKDFIASFFLGAAFQETARILIPYIAVGAFLKGIKLYAIDTVFHLTKQTKLQIIPVILAAVVNVALTIILIPPYGLEGAAIATVLAYALAITISWILLIIQRIPYLFPFKEFVKVLLASAAMIVSLLPFHDESGWGMFLTRVFIGIFTYSLVYAALHYYQIKAFIENRNERKKRIC